MLKPVSNVAIQSSPRRFSLLRTCVATLVVATAAACAPSASSDGSGTEQSIGEASTTTSTLACQSLTVTSGSIGSGQSAATLATRELTGTQDVWTQYVEFAPATSATCTFSLPAGTAASSVTALSLRLNYRGPDRATQRWQFEAYDNVAKAWVSVGDNAFATDWVWSAATLPLPASSARFFANGAMKIRYSTSSTVDSSQLDELVVLASTATTSGAGGAGGSTSGTGGTGGTTSGTGGTTSGTGGTTSGTGGTTSGTGGTTSGTGGTTSGTGGTTSGTGGTTSTSGYWKPGVNTSWQIQLSGTVDTSFSVQMYDIDLFDNSASTIGSLKAKGSKVICYFSAGSYENWRPDAASFPAASKGAPLDGWPGEWWLDVRLQAVRDIMAARMNLAVQKGCDGVDPDNVDGYSNANGVGLTAADQLSYNRFLAQAAHARGLTALLKNDVGQIKDLVSDFDGAVNEQCVQYGECGSVAAFVSAGKPVFGIEYQGTQSAVCSTANGYNFNTLLKNLSLDATRTACR